MLGTHLLNEEKMSEVYSKKRETLHLAFQLATLAAAQGDRDGFARVAHLYRTQQGCIYDEKALVENYRWAAWLHDSHAFRNIPRTLKSLIRNDGFGLDSW